MIIEFLANILTFYFIGQIFKRVNGQILNKKSSHLVTLHRQLTIYLCQISVLKLSLIFQHTREVKAQGQEHKGQLPLLQQEVPQSLEGSGPRGCRAQGLRLQQGQLRRDLFRVRAPQRPSEVRARQG